MLWLILALIASEVAMLLIGPRVLPVLRKLKFGQTIYELGPKSHRTKQGTPTMGGLMFAAVTCVVTLLIMSFDTWYGGWDFALALVLVSLLSMLIGFVDDFIKVVKKAQPRPDLVAEDHRSGAGIGGVFAVLLFQPTCGQQHPGALF